MPNSTKTSNTTEILRSPVRQTRSMGPAEPPSDAAEAAENENEENTSKRKTRSNSTPMSTDESSMKRTRNTSPSKKNIETPVVATAATNRDENSPPKKNIETEVTAAAAKDGDEASIKRTHREHSNEEGNDDRAPESDAESTNKDGDENSPPKKNIGTEVAATAAKIGDEMSNKRTHPELTNEKGNDAPPPEEPSDAKTTEEGVTNAMNEQRTYFVCRSNR